MEKALILVNEKDEITGYGEKMDVHRKGLLHRAFSVLIFNEKDEMLLQQRAEGKYHSEKLWSNACCSHPLRGEDILEAARKRLREEMGFECDLQFSFKFIYKAALDKGMSEHELDHVFTGRYEGPVIPDPGEVAAYRWESLDAIRAGIRHNPEAYTSWFPLIMERLDGAR